ncbi:MAG: ABC transporter permease subunit [Acetobacteraceae bacterium]
MLPAAMPQILTGLQVALPLALIVEVASEMLMGGNGLGGMMVNAENYADSVGVYAGIVEMALVGGVAVALMARLRRHLLRWHPEAAA